MLSSPNPFRATPATIGSPPGITAIPTLADIDVQTPLGGPGRGAFALLAAIPPVSSIVLRRNRSSYRVHPYSSVHARLTGNDISPLAYLHSRTHLRGYQVDLDRVDGLVGLGSPTLPMGAELDDDDHWAALWKEFDCNITGNHLDDPELLQEDNGNARFESLENENEIAGPDNIMQVVQMAFASPGSTTEDETENQSSPAGYHPYQVVGPEDNVAGLEGQPPGTIVTCGDYRLVRINVTAITGDVPAAPPLRSLVGTRGCSPSHPGPFGSPETNGDAIAQVHNAADADAGLNARYQVQPAESQHRSPYQLRRGNRQALEERIRHQASVNGLPFDRHFLQESGTKTFRPNVDEAPPSVTRLLYMASSCLAGGITSAEFGRIWRRCVKCHSYVFVDRLKEHDCDGEVIDVQAQGFSLVRSALDDVCTGYTFQDFERLFEVCDTCTRTYLREFSYMHDCATRDDDDF